MVDMIVKNFPLTEVVRLPMSKETYTKAEVDSLIKYAIEEARKIDAESMAKHNRDATVISMILGFTALALFVDGLLRLLGIIPPFMEIDIDLLDQIVDRVEDDVLDKLKQVPIQKLLRR
ncbi:gp7 [Prochlorococcus phage P-SSM4]|uniref:Gp7 n=3 Tax=Ronodorvirus ssm4 TaxID=2845939 RepID=Q58LU2_BPPRS|nr:gp7 [Prochlorococcus phage P-SSM4]AAX46807.1 gp7 [Prochlorococcus phage P-SSM4]